uniref:RBR-type E3 ubiquitin transferase n=1 Tax=Ditylenchus dipsaci TaxID=166011 RepID=A0A915ETB2_9BILA
MSSASSSSQNVHFARKNDLDTVVECTNETSAGKFRHTNQQEDVDPTIEPLLPQFNSDQMESSQELSSNKQPEITVQPQNTENVRPKHNQKKDLSCGPFSTSRLNLITFLNNIATSSAGSNGKRSTRSHSVSTSNTAASPSSKAQRISLAGGKKINGKIEPGRSIELPNALPINVEFRGLNSNNSIDQKLDISSESGPGFHWLEQEKDQLVVVELGQSSSSQNAPGSCVSNSVESVDLLLVAQTKQTTGEMPVDAVMVTRSLVSNSNGDADSCVCSSSLSSSSSSHQTNNCDKLSMTSAKQATTSGEKIKECPICFSRKPSSSFPELLTNCGHRSCKSCLVKYLRVEIMESRTSITCPECSELLHANDIYSLLGHHSTLVERYESFSLRRVLSTDPDTRWCPAPDCTYAVIANSCAACPQLRCERPDQTCDEARQGFLRDLIEAVNGSSGSSIPGQSIITKVGLKSGDRVKTGDIMKSCPRCGALIVKMNDGSCNHMVCALCGVEFCWLCLKQINELHYLSPTGCTFWGKKPWTRKKKLLWQVGTLIGAPLGIALIAGLAVPGIICGVPIFIGRKTYQRFSTLTRAKRHLITATAVTGSLVVSPVLAVMAVGVGVPIMLAYVYGVVPLSLCRNGGCGGGNHANSSSNNNENSDADVEAAYGEEDSDDIVLLTSERTQGDGSAGPSTSSVKWPSDIKGRKQQPLEVSHSHDRSATSSPCSAHAVNTISDAASGKFRRCSSGGGGTRHGNKSSTGGGSVCHRSNCEYASVVGTAGSRHNRRQSMESGINSLGEKVNTEDASVKAIAGSQYNYDDRSMWSNGGGVGQHSCFEVASYNEDEASTKACGGSVMESRSLANESLTACSAAGNMTTSTPSAHLSMISRERDVSPNAMAPAAEMSSSTKFEQHRKQFSLSADEHPNRKQSATSNSKKKSASSTKSKIARMSSSASVLRGEAIVRSQSHHPVPQLTSK